ncbi:endolytic transglycosylase MltG [Patescibacteria group bacterium]|nr:endolytic transglycosylase MltG [Patescibacteria group bacterium]
MKRLLLFVFSFVVLVAVAALLFLSEASPVNPSASATKVFMVNKGDGIKSIARRLETNGFIKNRYIFIAHAYLLGLNQKLQAGAFELSPSWDTDQIVAKLSLGGRFDTWVKIIDGQRNEEIAATINQDDLFSASDFLAAAKDKQGYLYPDSYSVPIGSSLDQFFHMVNDNYTKKLATIKSDVPNPKLSDAESATLASLIEREARTLTSKQYVAGILLNRLNAGMPLQIDASVQYARDSRNSHLADYWQPVSKKDLTIVSPYNTYLNVGLPPTPICNPGYDALYAAYHPIASDYLFYLTGKDNQMHYAKTLNEHNANVAKYLR